MLKGDFFTGLDLRKKIQNFMNFIHWMWVDDHRV